jgi:hypothetical protein
MSGAHDGPGSQQVRLLQRCFDDPAAPVCVLDPRGMEDTGTRAKGGTQAWERQQRAHLVWRGECARYGWKHGLYFALFYLVSYRGCWRTGYSQNRLIWLR